VCVKCPCGRVASLRNCLTKFPDSASLSNKLTHTPQAKAVRFRRHSPKPARQ